MCHVEACSSGGRTGPLWHVKHFQRESELESRSARRNAGPILCTTARSNSPRGLATSWNELPASCDDSPNHLLAGFDRCCHVSLRSACSRHCHFSPHDRDRGISC